MMSRIAPERKEYVLEQMLPPYNLSISELAEKEGIAKGTLYYWRNQARKSGILMPGNKQTANHWSNSDKLQVIIETANLSETELSEYCRRKGPYSESLFRTLKYIPDYPYKGFNNLDEARAWVQKFTYWYNNEHQHSKIRFITPNQRHQGLDDTVLAKRKQVLLEAKHRHPDRFPNGIRRCDKVGIVWLNPDKDDVGNIVDKETLKKAS